MSALHPVVNFGHRDPNLRLLIPPWSIVHAQDADDRRSLGPTIIQKVSSWKQLPRSWKKIEQHSEYILITLSHSADPVATIGLQAIKNSIPIGIFSCLCINSTMNVKIKGKV